MSINKKLKILCPNCGIKIEQRVQRKMNKFWRGVQTTECEGCGLEIQWHHALHVKFKIGGLIFKVGVFILFLTLLTSIFKLGESSSLMFSIGLILILLGSLVTYTPNDKIKIELAKKHNNML